MMVENIVGVSRASAESVCAGARVHFPNFDFTPEQFA
ncbi:hypothetical protein SAMN05444678_1035 [Sphingomonas sp. YR710]|jgi:hypothetical protein|nr:hypothetical protein SAMN05444678_1035 [Sphingomonas sp. YR710]